MFKTNSSTRIVSLVIRWLILAAAVWLAASLVHGIQLEGWKSTLLVAGILGLLNLYLRPLLILLSLPVTILTLGLFVIVINAALLLLTDRLADHITEIHFAVNGFGAALLGAIVISLVTLALGRFIDPDRIARQLFRGL